MEAVIRYRIFFEFKACFIQKPDKKYRPIAIGEQFLLALHKIIKNRMMKMFKLSKEQYAFSANNRVLVYHEIAKYFKERKIILTIDLKNAFNSIS